MKASYSWQRLWVSDAEAPIDYSLDHDGYFSPWGRAQSLEHWQETPCLILLGEPGMGKSWEWTQLQQKTADGLHCFFNLGAISSADQLTTRIERKLVVKQWLAQADTTLWLWLDSFDEGLLHERKLAQALRELIEEWPKERLCFRILSRTATWPEFFTQQLLELFADQPDRKGVQKLHLAPLTQEQVQEAAETEGIVAADFFTAVENADAVAMAIRPVTLRLLFGLWQAGEFGGSVRRSKGELFEAGCRRLCEENWDEQRTRPDDYDPDIRLRVAAHLALLMVFGNRQTLLFYEPEGQAGERELLLREVVGETTLPGTKPGLVLGQPLVKQVLEHTSLFAPTSKQAFWAHQAYADFLAAWALHDAQVPLPQLRNLFRSTVPDAGVVPALRDTAVWLASLSPEFAAALVEMDALTAIRADGLTATDAQREQLVNDLFTLIQERHLYPYRVEPYLGRLMHTGLAAQLAGPLTDPMISPEARRLVNRLIEHCALRELVPLLAQQALNVSVAFVMRSSALRQLVHLADSATCQQLRTLIGAIPAEDDDDDFRGTLLRILWPNHLSARELASLLTPVKHSTHIGAYHRFFEPELSGFLKEHLVAHHLPTLLCWVLRQADKDSVSDNTVFESVTRTVVVAAWQHTHDDQIVRWLTPVLNQFWVRYYIPLPKPAELRNKILLHMVQRNALPDAWALVDSNAGGGNADLQGLVDLNDWSLVIELAEATSHHKTKATLLQAAYYLFNINFKVEQPEWQNGFAEIYRIAKSTAWLDLSPQDNWVVEVDSDDAESGRRRIDTYKKIRQKKRDRARKIRWVNSRTFRMLIFLACSTRKSAFASWQRIYHLLSRGGPQKGRQFLANVRPQFGWLRSYEALEHRIVHLAQRVVTIDPPLLATPYKLNTIYPAYLSALITTYHENPTVIVALTAEQWQSWIRLLLFTINWAEENNRQQLLAVALAHHRRPIVSQILGQRDFWQQIAIDEHGYIRLNDLLREVPDELLQRVVLNQVITLTWPLHFTQEVFRQLLELRFRPAELFRDALFSQDVTAPEPALHRLTLGAVRLTLFETEPTSEWWHYWQQAIRLGPALMRPLLESVGEWRRPRHADGIALLTDTQLAEILCWVVQELEVTEENDDDDWRTEKPAGRVRAFRNNVAGLLANRATAEAVETLSTLAGTLNYPGWLVYRLEEARETYSRIEWTPLTTGELLALCRNSLQRWVQGGEDLLEAIIESLDRLQGHMQGEPARAISLWYPVTSSGYRVRNGNKVVEENEVSDFVQAFLSDDLPRHISSIHREVQLRAPSRPGTGQEVDLYVTATTRNSRGELIENDKIIVFIEAKHNDNKEVESALDGQLVNRYLRNHPAKCGLFLVYWHTAETGRNTSRGSITDLRAELAQQAQAASKDGLLIRSYVLDIRLPDDI